MSLWRHWNSSRRSWPLISLNPLTYFLSLGININYYAWLGFVSLFSFLRQYHEVQTCLKITILCPHSVCPHAITQECYNKIASFYVYCFGLLKLISIVDGNCLLDSLNSETLGFTCLCPLQHRGYQHIPDLILNWVLGIKI